MLELGLKVLISYLLGSLNGSLIVGKFYGVDIRSVGSGNAGGTNALRTQGKLFAFIVMLIDVGKGYLPVVLLPAWVLPGIPLDPEVSRTWLTFACAGAAVVGHCYPVWFAFKGGKGAATAIGALIAIAPILLIPALLAFTFILITTGYVGLATMTAAVSLPVYLTITQFSGGWPAIIFLALLALFIVFTHRSNIQRMREGREDRIKGVMLFRK
jgi:glycerol-3-phosphate acyltransferase PlsY